MNERDSKLIYELKQSILEALWINTDDGLEYRKIKQNISETVENFLHPAQDCTGLTLNPRLQSGYYSLDSLMRMKGYRTLQEFLKDYDIEYRNFPSERTLLFNAEKKVKP